MERRRQQQTDLGEGMERMDWKTRLLHVGKDGPGDWAALAMPVYRGSTVLFKDVGGGARGSRPERDGYTYGLHGTPRRRRWPEESVRLRVGWRRCWCRAGRRRLRW